MTATTFTTQRQLMSKNMPADALTGPYAQQQKILLYILPVAFGLGGVAFPIGVLLYWTTSNLWTMGQQFYVIRNNPAPGTPAFKAKEDRDRAKAAKHGDVTVEETAARRRREADRRPAQRQQPKKQTRAQRRQAQGKAGTATEARSPPTDPTAPTRTSRPGRTERPEQGRHQVSPELDTDVDETSDEAIEETAAVEDVDEDADESDDAERRRGRGRPESAPDQLKLLEQEGDIAADYLEELLDIADLDGDLDMDVEGDRAAVSIVGADLSQLVGRDGEVLEALQELTRLAVYRETGERSRLMLDISGFRADKRLRLEKLGRRRSWTQVKASGERAELEPMSRVRAQGRARRGGRRRSLVGVRGRGAAALRGGSAGVVDDAGCFT